MKQLQTSQPKAISKRQYWSQRINNWKNGNLSQKHYCTQAGISYSAFAYWRVRLRMEERIAKQAYSIKPEGTFKQAVIKSLAVEAQSLSKHTITVTLLNKTTIEIPASLDQKFLASIFNALGGLS